MISMIEANKTYRIKGASPYFKEKYGTSNPEIEIKGTDKEVLGISWMNADGNIGACLFAMRSGFEGVPIGGQVYYGKIGGMGEFVHESELEEITE